MITLTSRAADRVRQMQEETPEAGGFLRVLVESGGCSGFQYGMSFDESKDDDTQLESEGVKIVMDPSSLAYMNGSSIDFDDGLQGKGFEINNPNAQSTCGCGKSFSLLHLSFVECHDAKREPTRFHAGKSGRLDLFGQPLASRKLFDRFIQIDICGLIFGHNSGDYRQNSA